jgi:hypothetical protein
MIPDDAILPRPFACPVCNGSGKVSRPPWVAGDQREWSSTTIAAYPCRACGGTGVLWRTEVVIPDDATPDLAASPRGWDATPLADRWCLNAWAGNPFCEDGHPAADGAPHYCDRNYQHTGRCRCTCGSTTTIPAPVVADQGRVSFDG